MKEWHDENKKYAYSIGFAVNAVIGFFSVYPAIGILFLWFGFFNPSTTKQKLLGTALFLGLLSVWFLVSFFTYKLLKKNIVSRRIYFSLITVAVLAFLVIGFLTYTRW
jgi:hypothetical protein